jgi:hypothetical protein
MRRHQSSAPLAYLAGLTAAALGLGPAAPADVNIELRPVPEACATHTVEVEIYAVSDSPSDQSVGALDAILQWDPAVLTLRGIDDAVTYPYAWLFSGFRDDHNLDGLNNTWTDGVALYTAWAQAGGPPAEATPSGLLVTRLRFHKVRFGSSTVVRVLPAAGSHTRSSVYSGTVPGLRITGQLRDASLTTGAHGDSNCDGVVDFGDIDPWVLLLSDPASWMAHFPGCDPANGDINCDQHVTFEDIDPFVALLGEQ